MHDKAAELWLMQGNVHSHVTHIHCKHYYKYPNRMRDPPAHHSPASCVNFTPK